MLRYRPVSYPDLCYIPWFGGSPIEFFWKNGSLIYIALYYSVFCVDCLPVVPCQHDLPHKCLDIHILVGFNRFDVIQKEVVDNRHFPDLLVWLLVQHYPNSSDNLLLGRIKLRIIGRRNLKVINYTIKYLSCVCFRDGREDLYAIYEVIEIQGFRSVVQKFDFCI
uniref:FBD domain-containing protein n=1 Tax=Strongyloides venezuelensis TaxID=75913 RepID=A0A0K0EXS8_STRVS